MRLFEVNKPTTQRAPILISFPHSGTYIPHEITEHYLPESIDFIDDTDWFLPQLYPFAHEMGITTIQANYTRWVIDLNRNPELAPLYNDGRLITGLCTTTDFLGNSIYRTGKEPDAQEVERRKEAYFKPYYEAVQAILDDLKEEFGYAILYDSHSIRSVVPSIQKQRFPDMILGTADGNSASANIAKTALSALENGPYETTYNHPFKGGNITRHFGKPALRQHALQLERCKDLYMNETETGFHEEKGIIMTDFLKGLFQELINAQEV